MNAQQLARRAAAADRHDAAKARWPDRGGAGFTVELEAVIRELQALTGEMPADTRASVEWARTFRWLGDAYFDLARGTTRELLLRGVEAYRSAERLLAASDPLELGKLQVNWANTLRGLAGIEDRGMADAALEKYRLGRSLLAQHDPHLLPMVDDLLASHEKLLSIWAMRDQMAAMPTLDPATATRADVVRMNTQLDQAATQIRLDASTIDRSVQRLAEQAGLTVDTSEAKQQVAQLGGGNEMAMLFDLLRQRFEGEVREGKVEPSRAAALSRLLDELQEFAGPPPDDIAELAYRTTRMRELIARIVPLMQRPSHGLSMPPEGSRAHAVLLRWAALGTQIAALANRPNAGPRTAEAGRSLFADAALLDRELYVAGDDDVAALTLERERLRGHAAEARRFALLGNLTLARPSFGPTEVHVHTDRVFFAGSSAVRTVVERAASLVGMRLQPDPAGEVYGHARWVQLREAGLGVFDFTSARTPALRATVAYELGLARSLGVPVVVIRDDAKVPFDVAVVPVELRGDDSDAQRIAAALDDASYSLPAEGASDGIVPTARELIARHGDDSAHPGVAYLLRELGDRLAEPDAKAIEHSLRAVLLQLADAGLVLLQPAWPAGYPAAGRPRLFHVMPFAKEFDHAMAVVERTCGHDVDYARHDRTADDRIIVSLWHEICRASHVLVDITGLNENVAMELGFADALGKAALLVARSGTVRAGLFPSIEVRRVHEYADDAQLAGIVARFVRPAAATLARAPKTWPSLAASTARPGIAAIAAQLERALREDATTDGLRALLQQGPLAWTNPGSIPEVVQFVRGYVGSVGAALEATWRVAVERGVAPRVAPMFDRIEQYWANPHDVLPDHLGLAGVCDDAYLAHQAMLAIRGRELGIMPSPEELQHGVVMRNVVIGEPFASQLDALVVQIVLGAGPAWGA